MEISVSSARVKGFVRGQGEGERWDLELSLLCVHITSFHCSL